MCEFSAKVKGNFIESLEYLSRFDNEVEHIYLFPNEARYTGAKMWIDELNSKRECAYIQEDSFVKNVFLLKKIIKKHNITYIIRHFTNYKNDVILKLVFNSKKVIRFFHMMYVTENECPIKHFIRTLLWKNNHFVGVSNAVSNALKTKFKNCSVFTIENAIHFERLKNNDEFSRLDKISLLMMGYDISVKGVDLALTIAEKLKSEYNIVLYIVVVANLNQVTEYIVQRYGKVPEWVILLPPTQNIATYYNNIDIFLSPSRTEACPCAVVEAAWCNKSVVASKVGGQAELKIDGVYWFESENIDEFYKQTRLAIEELKSDEKIAEKELARQKIEKYYALDRWCQDITTLINNL